MTTPPSTPSIRWSIAGGVLAAAAVSILCIPLLAREDVGRVTSRTVAKQTAPGPAPSPTHAAATGGPAIAWTLPAGWSDAPAKPMRLAVFSVPPDGECGLFVFPGGGDKLANVNRWRGQVGLPPLDQPGLEGALAAGDCGFGRFSWLSVAGADRAFLAAMLDTPGGQCFVKLEAPPARLAGLTGAFLAFCASLRPAEAR